VSDFFTNEVLSNFRKLYKNGKNEWSVSKISGGAKQMEACTKNTWNSGGVSKQLELLVQKHWDRWGLWITKKFINQGEATPMDMSFIGGPSKGQEVHMDSLLPSLHSIALLNPDFGTPTQMVNLEHYKIFHNNVTASAQNLDVTSLIGDSADVFGDNFDLDFWKEVFVPNCGALGPDPKCWSLPNLKAGECIFFDGRVLHKGPKCDKNRVVMYRNWFPNSFAQYWEYPVLQYEGNYLKHIIHGI